MIYLREITKSDLPIINKWRNDRNIVDMLGSPFRFINIETDENWFQEYQNHRDRSIRLAICDIDTNSIIGVVYLTDIDWINRTARYNIMIGETAYQNKGVGKSATDLMLEHAFNDMNLHKLWLRVLENNLKAISLYEKCGFIKEGVNRQHIFKNGMYVNLIAMGILKEEWVSLRNMVK